MDDNVTLSRNLPAPMLTALGLPVINPILLIYLDWPGGILRFHTNSAPLTWGGFSWTGVSDLIGLSMPEESFGLVRAEASLQMAGTLEDVLAYSIAPIKNRRAVIYSGVTPMRGEGNPLGASEYFGGVMDGASVPYSEDGVYYLNVALSRGPEARSYASVNHSQEAQEREYPGDGAGRHCQLAPSNAAALIWRAP